MENVESNLIRCPKFVITVGNNDEKHKVLNVVFSKSGGIFVSPAYFKKTDGLAGLYHHKAGQKPGPVDIVIGPEAKVTSSIIKYSHPIDGNAHFSQDGKVITSIKKQSVRLDSHEGHLFTIMLQGLSGNKPVKSVRDSHKAHKTRSVVNFDVPGDLTARSIKFVGWWEHVSKLRFGSEKVGPKVFLPNKKGGRIGFALTPPPNYVLSDRTLILTCETEQPITTSPDPIFSFVGGFDEPHIVNDLTKDTSFMSFVYPLDKKDAAQQRFGSMDFRSDGQTPMVGS